MQWCTGENPPLLANMTDYTPFYTSPECSIMYQAHVRTFLNRVNTGALFCPVAARHNATQYPKHFNFMVDLRASPPFFVLLPDFQSNLCVQ